ncbi:alpha/beta hydrolase [Dongia deserti]|uniref:alpha/beta hydrolase n=1 Tax=Dongia deserti TaxID=2268030 RepID=UPI000E651E66|nr:dienelactone hydrolase family protein [Dongia deserti]
MELSGSSHAPASGGKAKQLVVLLHGYGSNGDDLISLAPFFAQALPEAEFMSPNAPFPCEISAFGFQWFGFEDRTPDMLLGGARLAAEILDRFLDAELTRRGLADRDLALVGFSQGTMMSLHVGLRRPNQIAGILGFSGSLIAPQLLAGELKSKPPVFLVHGTADQVVPFGALAQAEKALRDAGVPIETESRPGLPHSIDQIGAQRGALFLRRCFNAAPAVE